MKFYHRTTEEKWLQIQEEGILFGVHDSYRYTYLSPYDWGLSYGTVLLEVEYEPKGVGYKDENDEPYDNYGFNPPEGLICNQFSVFKPIDLKHIKQVLKKESRRTKINFDTVIGDNYKVIPSEELYEADKRINKEIKQFKRNIKKHKTI